MFTLYENILKESADKKLTKKQKNKFLDLINVLDLEGKELIYMLIKQHSTITNDETLFDCIIKNKDNGNQDLIFDINKLPAILSQILYNFLILHEKRSLRETNRNNIKNEIMSQI